MNKATWTITTFAPHYYNVHIITDGYYCGVGRFCETWAEALAFAREYNAVTIRQEGTSREYKL